MRRLILPVVVLLIAGYFIVFGGEYDLFDVRRLKRERAAEAAQLRLLRDSLALMRARVDSLENDPATLERLAREKYGMVKPGERLYRFAPPPADTASDTTRTPAE